MMGTFFNAIDRLFHTCYLFVYYYYYYYYYYYLIVLHKWTASKFNVLNNSPFETLHATFQSTPSPVSYLAIA
jgi:hypothetical protein